MGIGFVILIHLIILFMMSLICSLIAGVIDYFTSNKKKEERKNSIGSDNSFCGFVYFLYLRNYRSLHGDG
jgi:Na+-transporting methylmalonyl-CoA/oxaloacetate decarboxylase gamma subunit